MPQGSGFYLECDVNGDSNFVRLTRVTKIAGPSIENEEVDETDLDSTAKERSAGDVPDYKEISFTIFYDPTNTTHTSLRSLAASGTTRAWRATWPSAALVATFDAYVSKFDLGSAEINKNRECEVTIAVDGAVTFT